MWLKPRLFLYPRASAAVQTLRHLNFTRMEDGCTTQSKSHVLLDLDGTLLDTDSVADEVLKEFLAKYGKQWDGRGDEKRLGKSPLEAAALIVEDYQLPCTPQQFMSEIWPSFENIWCKVKPLPGAVRLIKHLQSHSVPMALASNSPRKNIEEKLSYQQGWKESFSIIIGGDEVEKGKPSPQIFLEAAKKLHAEPSSCLVIEDSLVGVTAGKAAGMEVVVAGSIRTLPKFSKSRCLHSAQPSPCARPTKTRMRSPNNLPGSFRCSLHRSNNNFNSSKHSHLNASWFAMTNSLLKIVGVAGEWLRTAPTALIRSSSHHIRRRNSFSRGPAGSPYDRGPRCLLKIESGRSCFQVQFWPALLSFL